MQKWVTDRIQSWLNGSFDEETKEKIRSLLDKNPQELSDAFFKDISFGTGGMRALMGVGTNRLNIYTIRMATQGLANYLKKGRVFIGYDVRNHSRAFAEEAAKVLSGNGITALLSQEICPTPLVSFACRYYKCAAAIMITASHNPPEYNGYKVYGADGCQVVFPHDAGIMAEVKKIKNPDQVLLGDSFEEIDETIDDAYLLELKKLQKNPALPLKIIYTNLHGTGIRLLPKALSSWGYRDLSFVEKQLSLDGNFPYAPSPNPEEPKAMELGLEQLKINQADLLIATDPDADRMGIATPDGLFTGNQIACLCLHHICRTRKLPPKAAFIKTIVTTELFQAIAKAHQATCVDVLTGFKYIGEKIGIWEKDNTHEYIFGGEESYGYLYGTFVRDKDAISSACLIVEAAAYAKAEGRTLLQTLLEIYREYGTHRESLTNLSFKEGEEGLKQMEALMGRLRKSPPKSIGNIPITSVEDYLHGHNGLPASNVLRFWLEDQTKLVIRPSGTEPKIKLYAETVLQSENPAQAIISCDQRLEKTVRAFREEFSI